MDASESDAHSLNAQVLDEDLQIVRATLAMIANDVGQLSGTAGRAIEEALEKIDQAQQVFLHQCLAKSDTGTAPAAVVVPELSLSRTIRRYARRSIGR